MLSSMARMITASGGSALNNGCGLQRIGDQGRGDIDQANAKDERAGPLCPRIGLPNEVTANQPGIPQSG
jgi:hypothetical protein